MTCGSQRWSSESARSQGVTAIVQFAWDTTMFYNNPFNQLGMYNNAPGMYYNNPFNQFGMYSECSPA